MLTTGGAPEEVRRGIEAFREGGGEGKPVVLQAGLNWAMDERQAVAEAIEQWSACAVGGEVAWDLRRPADFDLVAKPVGEAQMRSVVRISSDLGELTQWLAELAALGPDEIHLHQVGRNQREFIEYFGAKVLPLLRPS